MKKKLIKLSLLATLLLLVFIIAFVVTNLFDAPEPEGVYTMNDLVQTSLGSDNGYYLLMALSYPTNMDITSPEVFTKIRKFSDPGLLSLGSKEIHKRAKIHNNLYKKLKIKGETGLIYKFTENLKKINSEKDKIEEFLNSNQVLMQRYRQLLESEKIEDFSLPTYSYPIPHLVNVIKATNLYTARQILNVLDDRWDDGIQGILKQISFYRKLGRSSRQLVNKAVSLRMINHSLKALVFIMNRKDCPKTVFSTILNGLTPLEKQEISMRNPILFEFLNATQGIQEILTSEEPPFAPISVLSAGFWPNKVDWYNFLAKFRIFLNRNRTIRHYLKETNKILKFEKTPPYEWKQNLADLIPPDPTKSWFWWFSNPIGKVIMVIGYGHYQDFIFKKYQTQAIFDMLRICTEFHLKFNTEKPISEILETLDNYKSIDPFSGKSYLYNEKKKIIYSVGINRVDDGGKDTKDDRGKTPDLVISLGL